MGKMDGSGPEKKGPGSGRGLGYCFSPGKEELIEKLGKGMGMKRKTGGGKGKGKRLRTGDDEILG
jgi:hypothetical protein